MGRPDQARDHKGQWVNEHRKLKPQTGATGGSVYSDDFSQDETQQTLQLMNTRLRNTGAMPSTVQVDYEMGEDAAGPFIQPCVRGQHDDVNSMVAANLAYEVAWSQTRETGVSVKQPIFR